jgi:hypothetical protein
MDTQNKIAFLVGEKEMEFLVDGLRMLRKNIKERGYTAAEGRKISELCNKMQIIYNNNSK